MRISDWSSDVCSSDLSGVVINQYDIIGAYPNQQLVPSNEAQKSDFDDNFTEEFQIQGNINDKHNWVIGYFINKATSDDLGLAPVFLSFNNAFSVPLDNLNFLFPSTVNKSEQAEIGYFGQFTADLSGDRKSTRLNSSHSCASRMPSSA